jgi:hypothetical protein
VTVTVAVTVAHAVDDTPVDFLVVVDRVVLVVVAATFTMVISNIPSTVERKRESNAEIAEAVVVWHV